MPDDRRYPRAAYRAHAVSGVAVASAIGAALAFLARPGFMGGSPAPLSWAWWGETGLPVLGLVGVVVGLAWILRIDVASNRTDPEPWRYRDLD